MAIADSPRSTSILAILLAVVVGYIGYSGDVLSYIGVPGLKERSTKVEAIQDTVGTLEKAIADAKAELAKGSVEEVRKAVEGYRATLSVLREFVPNQSEVPNLLDDITSRAKIRGVNLAGFVPEPIAVGPPPFDTYGYDMSVIGRYDQIGGFLADIAGLRRIIVPLELHLVAADRTKAAALGDTTSAMLEATFKMRTYVKTGAGGTDGK